MKTAVEIYKLLPKTNCGACGVRSCFGFAAKVAANMASVAECPGLGDTAREALPAEEGSRTDSPGTVYEHALKALKEKNKAVDFRKAAALLGGETAGADSMELIFLNEKYQITKEGSWTPREREARPWISILIYNHLCMPDLPAPSGEWITFSSVPASHAKDKAWAGHVEEVIAGHFSGNVEGLRAACERMGAVTAEVRGNYDAAFEFRFFPATPCCSCSLTRSRRKTSLPSARCSLTGMRRATWISSLLWY